MSLVAGWLLDRTEASEAGKATLAPEYAANLEQNVADAVSRIPKLTTGGLHVHLWCIRVLPLLHMRLPALRLDCRANLGLELQDCMIGKP